MLMEKAFVVIPAYNESPEVLRRVVAPLCRGGYRVVVVDDGSRDPAAPALAGLPAVALRHRINRGQGAALQTGMEYCRRHGATCCIHYDADGQHDPAEIPALLAAIRNGADIALGSRFLRPEDVAAVPPMRRGLLRLARCVNGALTGMWLTDAHNGFRALGRRALECIDITEDRMAHASQILSQIRRHRLRCVEVPTHIVYSDYSVGKGQGAVNAVNILIDLLLDRFMG